MKDNTKPNEDDRSEKAKPEPADEQERTSRENAIDQMRRRIGPPRRPLFRN